jgi:hypothetical protein
MPEQKAKDLFSGTIERKKLEMPSKKNYGY